MAHWLSNVGIYSARDPDYPGRGLVNTFLWLLVAFVLFRFWRRLPNRLPSSLKAQVLVIGAPAIVQFPKGRAKPLYYMTEDREESPDTEPASAVILLVRFADLRKAAATDCAQEVRPFLSA
jgi:hypothetical protein